MSNSAAWRRGLHWTSDPVEVSIFQRLPVPTQNHIRATGMLPSSFLAEARPVEQSPTPPTAEIEIDK